MEGFAKNAIILLPKEENYWSKDDQWLRSFQLAVENVIKFITLNFHIVPEALTTDALAVYLSPAGVKWINVSAPEDIYFVRRNCDGLDKMPEGRDVEGEYYKEARTKFPIVAKMTREERFSVAAQRERLVFKKVIQECKLVISFENPYVAQYKTYKELKKDRIVLIVSHLNFTVKAYYNGEEIGFSELTNIPWTLNPANTWRVE